MNLLLSPSRVAFNIAGYDIYWYGLIIASALVIDFILVLFLCKRKKLGSDAPFDLTLFIVPLGIVFARLFAVLFDEDLTLLDYFNFRGGGMSIIGAIFGGVLGVLLYSLIKKRNFFQVADIIAPLVILAQSIGRWGNYFNQEIYGAQITNPNDQWFPLAVYIDAEGGYFQALFFYESILNLLGFAFLITLFLSVKKNGIVVASYLIYYGTVRFILESLRQEQYILRMLGLPISKVLSAVMIACGIAILLYVIISESKKKKLSDRTTRL